MKTDEEIKEELKEGIGRIKKYKEEKKHPHCLVCESFNESFNLKLIQIRDNEVWIIGEYHKIDITYCPFCKEDLRIRFDFDSMIEGIENNI